MSKQSIVRTILELEREARSKGMVVDYESATLQVPLLRTLTPHQRDIYVATMNKREFFKDYQDGKDNDPADPSEAWA